KMECDDLLFYNIYSQKYHEKTLSFRNQNLLSKVPKTFARDLGASHDSTKECLALMIQKIEGAEYSDLYEYCLEKIKKLHSE
ncbi:hypothetical protein A3Q56_05781, partial [Intoshia linei]